MVTMTPTGPGTVLVLSPLALQTCKKVSLSSGRFRNIRRNIKKELYAAHCTGSTTWPGISNVKTSSRQRNLRRVPHTADMTAVLSEFMKA